MAPATMSLPGPGRSRGSRGEAAPPSVNVGSETKKRRLHLTKQFQDSF